MVKTIRITRGLSCVSFQVLALPEPEGFLSQLLWFLDQTIVWKGIQWHLLQRNPDRFTFQGKTYSYVQTTQIQSQLQTMISIAIFMQFSCCELYLNHQVSWLESVWCCTCYDLLSYVTCVLFFWLEPSFWKMKKSQRESSASCCGFGLSYIL